MLGCFRKGFSKGGTLGPALRIPGDPREDLHFETWLGNPIFWIEAVGGTLDPKNWMKTKPTDNIAAVVGDTH